MTVPNGAPQASNATIDEAKSRHENRYIGVKQTGVKQKEIKASLTAVQ